MVMIATGNSPGEKVHVNRPLFAIAASLPNQLNSSFTEAPMGLDEHLKKEGIDGVHYASTKSVSLPDMDPFSTLTLPVILQDAYDKLPGKTKPRVKFFSVVAIQYRDKDGTTRQFQSSYDAENGKDETIKANLQKFVASHQRSAINARSDIVAASLDGTVELPAGQMQKSISDTHQAMFQRNRYVFGEYDTGDRVVPGAALKSPADTEAAMAADRLLEPVARVYGGKLVVDDTSGRTNTIIPENLFEAMERGEMPDRYRGRAGKRSGTG